MTVTFFGHRTVTQSIEGELRRILIDLIENDAADTFYIGNQGAFDEIVLSVLGELRVRYPHVGITVVFAYLPKASTSSLLPFDTLYPEEVAVTPPKFSISKRNLWMISHSDTVITYVLRSHGGAATYKEIAIKKHKRVVEIGKPEK